MLRRDRIEIDFPVLAHDVDKDLFLIEGAGKEAGYLGVGAGVKLERISRHKSGAL